MGTHVSPFGSLVLVDGLLKMSCNFLYNICQFIVDRNLYQLELIKHISRVLALSTVLIQEPMSCQRPFSYGCDAVFAWTTLTFV